MTPVMATHGWTSRFHHDERDCRGAPPAKKVQGMRPEAEPNPLMRDLPDANPIRSSLQGASHLTWVVAADLLTLTVDTG